MWHEAKFGTEAFEPEVEEEGEVQVRLQPLLLKPVQSFFFSHQSAAKLCHFILDGRRGPGRQEGETWYRGKSWSPKIASVQADLKWVRLDREAFQAKTLKKERETEASKKCNEKFVQMQLSCSFVPVAKPC